MARRETCFKSFINPPTHTSCRCCWNTLRRTETDVKSVTTRCCGPSLSKHNRERKYELNQQVTVTTAPRSFGGLSATIPPFLRRLSAVFCTALRGEIHRKSTSFPHLLHMIFMHDSRSLFPQLLRCDSEGNSRRGRRKRWRRGLRRAAAAEKGGVDGSINSTGLVPQRSIPPCTTYVTRGTLEKTWVGLSPPTHRCIRPLNGAPAPRHLPRVTQNPPPEPAPPNDLSVAVAESDNSGPV